MPISLVVTVTSSLSSRGPGRSMSAAAHQRRKELIQLSEAHTGAGKDSCSELA
ncbi:hypothetical protein [Streptomyces sp. NPDC088246]|uniref:hypothetical protein n=1 Tax=Streptomyces sp. NPDC088246 TaxID=3365842 RepID=UPI0037F95D2F